MPMALATVHTYAYLLFVVAPIVLEFCVGSLYREVFLSVFYRFFYLAGKRELVKAQIQKVLSEGVQL